MIHEINLRKKQCSCGWLGDSNWSRFYLRVMFRLHKAL